MGSRMMNPIDCLMAACDAVLDPSPDIGGQVQFLTPAIFARRRRGGTREHLTTRGKHWPPTSSKDGQPHPAGTQARRGERMIFSVVVT